MAQNTAIVKPRWFAPEVIQTSAMDCGPASLKALLEGFGISVSYGRLREACQTDVDGTSIDTLEEIANQLGLVAEQVMLPPDHVLLPESQTLPALVVIRLPNGVTHFVVAWRRWGRWVQVMDPGTGRRWMRADRFLSELYIHQMPIPAGAWREWAGSDDFLHPLRHRLADLGQSKSEIEILIKDALVDEGWMSLAALDAATRMVTTIVRAGGLKAGQQAGRALSLITQQAQADQTENLTVPDPYWSVRPTDPDEDGEAQILLRGAVLLQVARHQTAPSEIDNAEPDDILTSLAPDLVAALEETPQRPGLELLNFLRADGILTPLVLMLSLLLAAGSLVVEAMLFRGLFDLSALLGSGDQRLSIMGSILFFILALLLVRIQIIGTALRLGRGLETRLRMAFLRKIPRLHDRYFQSRLMSDMAERSHSVHQLRLLPMLGANLIQLTFTLILTVIGIIWLDPSSTILAIISGLFALGVPLLAQTPLRERDLRVRTHLGALSRFYLDSLLGLIPVRVHGAERAVRREHEGLLVEWGGANLSLLTTSLWVEGLQMVTGFGLAIWLLFQHVSRGGEVGSVLLLVYWALQLPVLGQEIALLARQYPSQRNITLRLLEPLGAPETTSTKPDSRQDEMLTNNPQDALVTGVEIALQDLAVRAGGHIILHSINLQIKPGSQVAIVGPSGAGKSSLVGLLLGWHKPAAGQIVVDGQLLDDQQLQQLRQQTAWVDPAVQLWNRSLLNNLSYGQSLTPELPIGTVIEQSDLIGVLEKLSEGLQHPLGEEGALLSGGEGQRVRLGRAMLHPEARLVILDEPFRGLDREKRRQLLAQTRRYWPQATLLYITHDVGQTEDFERVLVIEAGQIVEDDAPTNLLAQPDSRYKALLQAEDSVREGLWSSAVWRRLWLEDGTLAERGSLDEGSA
ncbi:MAG: ATP-binding cassette domain-containing protein [Chloroflexota bacterium]